jgi:16S rRNA (cytosine1402-N4)-methyltransferase
MSRPDTPYHVPVLVEPLVAALAAVQPRVILDATFGGGGHSRALLAAMPGLRVIALDRDPDAAAEAQGLVRVALHRVDFQELEAVLKKEGLDELDGAVFDLGVSSHQFDVGERGFSYRSPGPLDMRMGPDAQHDAAYFVNDVDRSELARIIGRFGEERFAGRIADAIVAARPIGDTGRLAEVVAAAVPARARDHGHPARRTFQALRIAVNDELAALAAALDAALRVLRGGGRIAVISYHSLEDRIVKRRFAAGAVGCTCPPDFPVCICGGTPELRLVTRKSIRPGAAEVAANPRARSARLRIAEKC